MLTRLHIEHDIVHAKYSRDWKHTSRESLAKDQQVRPDSIVIAAKALAGAAQPCLDLVGDQEHIVPLAYFLDLAHVAIIWHNHACLALDGLHHEPRNCRVGGQLGLERLEIVVRDQLKTWDERPKAGIGRRVRGGGNSANRPAPEVARRKHDLGLVVRDALHVIAPSPSELDSRLAGLHSRVHREDAVIAEEARHVLRVGAKDVIVESPRGQRQLPCLVLKSGEDAWMRVALVHGRIGTEKVQVLIVLHIPDTAALAHFQHHGQRTVVPSIEFILLVNVGLGLLSHC
mmetsp:Transcript_13472/g.39218  ORF Transcript_13472/g.39218 Transcript_13472/m.39218 type:complete len:287 (-) Transcript_13472:123-983(-)